MIATTSDDCDVSLMAKDQYIRDVHWTESLSAEEEAKLVLRVHRGRLEQLKPEPNQWYLSLAKHARDALIEAYQPDMLDIAYKLIRPLKSLELLDLVQEGTLGLMHVLDQSKFFHAPSVSPREFRLYACECIRCSMRGAVRASDGMIRIPKSMLVLVNKFRDTGRALSLELGRVPTTSEIAMRMGVSEERACELAAYTRCRSVDSIEKLLEDDGDGETIGGDRIQFVGLFEQYVETEKRRHRELDEALSRVIENDLSRRQREVVTLRYGFAEHAGNGLSISQVAAQLGIGDAQVWKCERVAKEKLQRSLAPMMAIAQEELTA
ncbi:hypothetical protein KSD_33680 [Ktedonobacter sp. SOSP1-85]|uniref:sigma-70 family RNA polymerase sigma factor n=1 Tax=Ktedonobacter sp. SOSP1-85 TaxID=2778367 RepID=UPI00191514BB|nr:sigma-70 family RNA polymerase sigma factor [Ktedonobacter sp. SOSP1-85]GHO75597.1 hypothetical protein KSD_33680 [Ktedonobacter sp. SOSP1-85]